MNSKKTEEDYVLFLDTLVKISSIISVELIVHPSTQDLPSENQVKAVLITLDNGHKLSSRYSFNKSIDSNALHKNIIDKIGCYNNIFNMLPNYPYDES